MQEVAQTADDRYDRDERLKTLAENIVSLNRKCDCFEEKITKCNQGIEKSMEEMKSILSSSFKKRNSHHLLRNILNKVSELLEEKDEAKYHLKKYRYHQKRAQEKLSFLQDEVGSFLAFHNDR